MNHFSDEVMVFIWFILFGIVLLKAIAVALPTYFICKWFLCQKVHDPVHRKKLSKRAFRIIFLTCITVAFTYDLKIYVL